MKKDGTLKRTMTLLLLLAVIGPMAGAAADGIATAGDILQFAVPAVAFGTTWEKDDAPGALQLVKAYALSLGTTYLLKVSVPEERPNGGSHSFPSGHTSDVFTSAEFMRVRYGFKWGLPFYLAGAFVAYSRVESDQHYVHDVIAGAAIGIVSSHLFARPYHGWNAAISFEHGGVAVGFKRQF